MLAAAIGALVISNAVQAESGLLTFTLLGLYLGNRERLHLHHVQEFTEHLQVFLAGVLFVVLAGREGKQCVEAAQRLEDLDVPCLVVDREFAQVLGRAHVYQVRRGDAPAAEETRAAGVRRPRTSPRAPRSTRR